LKFFFSQQAEGVAEGAERGRNFGAEGAPVAVKEKNALFFLKE
jgi:hypothetical protein